MKRGRITNIVALILAATVLTTVLTVEVKRYEDFSHSISIHQNQAHAQAETGLLAIFIEEAWPYFWYLIQGIGIASAVAWAWNQISSLFAGRPDFGKGSAAGCDATWMLISRNRLLQNLGAGFVTLQHQGASLSNSLRYLYTQKAANFCTDVENTCGYSLGSFVCQQYLYVAANANNACANQVALDDLAYLDNAYPQCWGH